MEQQSRQERYEMIDRLKENPQEFETNPIAQNDRLAALTIVEQDGSYLQYAERHIRDDKEVVMAAVAKAGTALQYASEKLRDDKEVVMAAIRQDGWSVLLAGPNCQQDIDCIKLAEKTVDIKAFLPPERVPQIVVRHTTDKGIER